MKINIYSILSDHFATLVDGNNKKMPFSDFITFFLTPLFVMIILWYTKFKTPKEAYNISITVLGIFIGLFFNLQVIMFSVFQRKWADKTDIRLNEIQKRKLNQRRELLSELNANISYIIAFCSISIVLFFVFYILDGKFEIESSVFSGLCSHLIFTILMTLKRSYILFKMEYLQD